MIKIYYIADKKTENVVHLNSVSFSDSIEKDKMVFTNEQLFENFKNHEWHKSNGTCKGKVCEDFVYQEMDAEDSDVTAGKSYLFVLKDGKIQKA